MRKFEAVRDAVKGFRCKPGMDPVKAAADFLDISYVTLYQYMRDPEASGTELPNKYLRQLHTNSDSDSILEWFDQEKRRGKFELNGSTVDELRKLVAVTGDVAKRDPVDVDEMPAFDKADRRRNWNSIKIIAE